MESFRYDHGVKLVAIITMIVDHVGMIFLPEIDGLRVVGRLSLPLFAYLVAEGMHRTGDRHAYLSRLFVLFVCAQFPYGLFVGTKLNIFLPLVVGGLVTHLLIERRGFAAAGLLVAYEGFAYQHEISYGFIGPLLVVAFAVTRPHLVAATACVAVLFFADGLLSGSRFSRMAIFVVPLVPVVIHAMHWRSDSKWRWAYWVYPAHLALFYLVAWQQGLTALLRR